MYKKGIYTVKSNTPLTPVVYRMVLEGDTQYITRSGQFINIELSGKYLRRPISVCDYDEKTITIIYKVVGRGTEQMKAMEAGEQLDILTGLGNGFSTENEARRPLLVGGGVGVPPMYNLCRRLLGEGKSPIVVLGFNTAEEIFYAEEFERAGANVIIATADGSTGIKGFVTDAIRESDIDFDYFYSCGPLPMLKALCGATDRPGEVSLEERMGCGFGICMGCSIQTASGAKRVCKEGPVFKKEDVIW